MRERPAKLAGVIAIRSTKVFPRCEAVHHPWSDGPPLRLLYSDPHVVCMPSGQAEYKPAKGQCTEPRHFPWACCPLRARAASSGCRAPRGMAYASRPWAKTSA